MNPEDTNNAAQGIGQGIERTAEWDARREHLFPSESPEWSADEPVALDIPRRLASAAVAIGAGLVLGLFGLKVTGFGVGNPGWLVAFMVLLTGLILILRNFEVGIVLFLGVCWIAVGTPSVAQGGSGAGQKLQISQLGLTFLIFLWASRYAIRRDLRLYQTPLLVPMVLFLAICFWSTINGFLFPDPRVLAHSVKQYAQVNVFEILIRVLSLGGLLMLGNALRGRELRWASWLILLPGIATFTHLLPFVPASNFNAFPQLIAMALLASFVLYGVGRPAFRVGAALLVLAILGNYVIAGSEWSSGWIAGLTALAIIAFFAQRRLFWIGCGVFALLLLLNWGFVYDKVVVSNEQSSSFDRFKMMQSSVLYATHFPLGIGLGNYRSYNAYFGRPDVWNTTEYTSAHGTYSQALAETGILGLLALLLLLATIPRMLYRYWRALPEGYAKSYALGVLGGFCGVCLSSLIGDYLFPAYHNGGVQTFGSTVYTFLAVGVVVGMAREHGVVWSETAPAPSPRPAPAPLYHRGPYANTPSAAAAASPESGLRDGR